MGEDRLAKLTPAQRACVELLPLANTDKGIARCLGLSPKTVEAHISQAKKKLGISDRYALADLARAAAQGKGKSLEDPPPISSPVTDAAPVAPQDHYPADRLRDVSIDPTSVFAIAANWRSNIERREETHSAVVALQVIALICAIAAAITIFTVAALPTVQTWSALANAIKPHP